MRLSRAPFIALLLAAGALLAPAPARADDTDEFLKLENWEGRADLWTLDAKKKTVVGVTNGDLKANTFFCSKKKYGDFELSYKVQLLDGVGNSGVQVRSTLFDAKEFRVKGPQADAAAGYFGAMYGEGVGGYLLKPKKDLGKPKEFNDYKLVVKGNHITITLNGETALDEDFPDNKGKDPAPKDGIIAFQAHVGPKMRVEFKDIEFKDLGKK